MLPVHSTIDTDVASMSKLTYIQTDTTAGLPIGSKEKGIERKLGM